MTSSSVYVDVVYAITHHPKQGDVEPCMRLTYRRPGIIIAPAQSREAEEALIPLHRLHLITYRPDMGEDTDYREWLCKTVAGLLFGEPTTRGEIQHVSTLIEHNVDRVLQCPPASKAVRRRVQRRSGVREVQLHMRDADGGEMTKTVAP